MGGRLIARARVALVLAGAAIVIGGCSQPPPARRSPLKGQILAVNTTKQELVVKHEDIEGFMPAMTMSYAVATPKLLEGREPGELISATLEVKDSLGRLTSITHVGHAPIPANEAAMASGLLKEGDTVPDVAFIDQSDKRRSLAEWKGTFTVLTFIYTRCPLPDYCPLMDQNFATLQRRSAQDAALRGRVRLISVTLDPDYDTPAVLAAHAAARHADPAIWTFVTGDRGTIERFAGQMGVAVIHDTPPSLTHNLRTVVLDPQLKIVKIYSGNQWTPGEVLKELSEVR